ncbi:hypothetical protein TWF694_003011 [Orbilia ellipsospora]|uniref:Cupin 2 conserved barrel domain-containing protein n=1 Tax=Orbilia ellipsospora TaxID=2528407 RepID=A0AAV9X0H6_9PEZI
MDNTDNRPPNPTQASPLPGLTTHITTNSPHDGKAVIHSSKPAQWTHLFNSTMAFNLIYTNTVPPNVNTLDDVEAHEHLVESGGPGLTVSGGTVCRIVDFGPSAEPVMHRTQSLDFGVVLEGAVELILDGGEGERRLCRRGDVVVQRGTNHAWKNVTPNDGWARMLFVLQASEKITAGEKSLEEDVEHAGEEGDRLKQKM